MVKIIDTEWLVDTEAMICRNNNTKIVVKFEKSGNAFIGKIKDMPIELTLRLAKMKDGEMLLQKAVMDAEEIFLQEMFEKNTVGVKDNLL
jgi:hypothetical protein